jgi:TatD DNase family protein
MIKKRDNAQHKEFLKELEEAGKDGAVFTDSHAHIHFSPLADVIEEVLQRASDNYVKRIVTIGIDLKDSIAAKKLAEKEENIFFTAGVHPHDSSEFKFDQIAEFEKLVQHPKNIAIGEVGFDYYYDHSPRNVQKDVFLTFLDMAVAFEKPVVIHNRDASKDCIEVMDSMIKGREKNGIIHCYNGDKDIMRWALDNGFYISYAGPVTYPKAQELRDTLNFVPLDRLFIETDCPYLTPMPYRGKTNEPSRVVYTAKEVCDNKGVTLKELAVQLENNYIQLFG